MEVLEHQHEGPLGDGEHLERLSHRAEHPLPGRPQASLLQGLEAAATYQPGHLDQPGRRALRQQRDDRLTPGLSAQPPERFEHGM